jgi:hypothetical protein
VAEKNWFSAANAAGVGSKSAEKRTRAENVRPKIDVVFFTTNS